MKIRKRLFVLLTAIMSLCLLASAATITAFAETEVVMDAFDKACIRYADDESSGLRFATKLNGYDPATADSSVTYGMLIVPYFYVKNYDEGTDYIAKLEEDYPQQTFAYAECAPYQAGQTIADLNDTDGYYLVASLVELNKPSYTNEFVGIAYSENNGTRTYTLKSDYTEALRSVAYIASGVYAETEEEKQGVLDAYIDGAIENYGYTLSDFQLPVKESINLLVEESVNLSSDDKLPIVYSSNDVVDGGMKTISANKKGRGTVTASFGKYTATTTVNVTDTITLEHSGDELSVSTENCPQRTYTFKKNGEAQTFTNGTYSVATDNALGEVIRYEVETKVGGKTYSASKIFMSGAEVGIKQNVSKLETVKDGDKTVLSVSNDGNYFPQIKLIVNKDLSNLSAVNYSVKIAEGSASDNLYFLPNVAGSTNDRNDGHALTKRFIGKDLFTKADGYQNVTVDGLDGEKTIGRNDNLDGGVVKNSDGTYTVELRWIARSDVSTNNNYTIYLSDLSFVTDTILLNACDDMTNIVVANATTMGNATSNVKGEISTDMRRTALKVTGVANVFAGIAFKTDVDLSQYTSFDLAYDIHVASGSNGHGFIPTIAGTTPNRGDAFATTEQLLVGADATADGKNLTYNDLWRTVVIKNASVGIKYEQNTSTVYPGVTANSDGTYTVQLSYLGRLADTSNVAITFYIDNVRLIVNG